MHDVWKVNGRAAVTLAGWVTWFLFALPCFAIGFIAGVAADAAKVGFFLGGEAQAWISKALKRRKQELGALEKSREAGR